MSSLTRKHIFAGYVHTNGKATLWSAVGSRPNAEHLRHENPELTDSQITAIQHHLKNNKTEGSTSEENGNKIELHVVSKGNY